MWRTLLLRSGVLLTAAAPLCVPASASAGVFIGIGPAYYRPAPVVVYRPAPVVVADPAPVVVTPPPAVVTPAPVVVTSPPPAPVVVTPPPPPPVVVHEHRPWHVQYRAAGGVWCDYAAYAHRHRAFEVQSSLAHRGYEVRVVRY